MRLVPFSDEAVAASVRLARRAIAAHLAAGGRGDPALPFRSEPLPAVLEERRGVFVTLKGSEDGALRGCIGYPRPVEPLRSAIPHVAVSAAVEDPRFAPVRAEELPSLVVEVSVLTIPALLEARDPSGRRAEVVVGRDGLIVEARGSSGLLLPQVPVEQGWDSAEFLAGACEKAGLWPDAWLDLRTKVYRFEAEVFAERRPGGPVDRVALTPRASEGAPTA